MRQFLFAKGGAIQENVSNNEVVFDFKHPKYPHITIRIFSGIAKDTGVSRGCGDDALRVCALNTANGITTGWIKSKTAYRTKNWQLNLRDRCQMVINEARMRCEGKPFTLESVKTGTQ